MKSMMLAALVCFATSCTCWGSNSNTKACVVVRDVVDCTESGVESSIANFEPILIYLIDTLTGVGAILDWADIGADLINLGFQDGGCIMAALQRDLATKVAKMGADKSPLLSNMMKQKNALDAWWEPYKAANYGANVQFKMADGSLQ